MPIKDLTNTIKFMQDYGEELLNDLSKVMQDEGSLNLYKQLSYRTIIDSNSINIILTAPTGVYFFSEGRGPGKMPPEEPILRWMKQRGIRVRNSKGQFITDKAGSFLIRRKIGKEGTKNWREGTTPNFLKDFQLKKVFLDGVARNYGLDIINDITIFAKNNLDPGTAGVHRVS